KRFKQLAGAKRRPPLLGSTRCEKASKPPFLRGFVLLACAALVISALRKSIFNISAFLPRLNRFLWEHGSMEMHALPLASPLSRGFTMQLKGVSQQCLKWTRAIESDHLHEAGVLPSSHATSGRSIVRTAFADPVV